MIKKNTVFEHKKGGKYVLLNVVHPSSEKPYDAILPYDPVIKIALHTELNSYIRLYCYYNGKEDIIYSDIDEYLVLYQGLNDSAKTDDTYVRPIQMFFEHTKKGDNWVHRFEPIKKDLSDNPE